MGLQQTLRALADPIRLEILILLRGGRRSAGEISDNFEVTGASVSRHLSVLKQAELVRDKREGKYIFYELNPTVLDQLEVWIKDFKSAFSVS
ncbi:MAG: winged helix-turn-helix transcriptional regulator [Clostridia bacterium]|nr:winged helix-turn-helix transcriptional regulator [Clostridia bacterium]